MMGACPHLDFGGNFDDRGRRAVLRTLEGAIAEIYPKDKWGRPRREPAAGQPGDLQTVGIQHHPTLAHIYQLVNKSITLLDLLTAVGWFRLK